MHVTHVLPLLCTRCYQCLHRFRGGTKPVGLVTCIFAHERKASFVSKLAMCLLIGHMDIPLQLVFVCDWIKKLVAD
ncbi:hypothetical protein HOLleu_36316 [Holothuria leucospilota]|uniref:Uncharacterized protein n=1 Tax=Holothuria leucospilota TaxID=206669 RepID=A0A9Q1BFL2_HOLLE|nr:hypothetical protein HOLleu_36316 [Holothuria leucospilota]